MGTSARGRWWWAGWLLAATLLALIPILAIIQPGLPNTADGYVHLLRALETTELVRAGHLYPRWAPDFYLGYGYPFFNFYAPGAHLLIAAFALAGLGVLRGLVALQVLALLLYPTGAFLAARSLLRGRGDRVAVATASLAAAAVYLYAPLRFRELFTQGNLSQLLALGWLPWAAWALIEMIRRGSWRWSAAAGLALAGLVYAHHPSAFLGFPTLAAFALWLAVVQGGGPRTLETRQGILLIAAAFGIGVALSAPFWLPAVTEMRYVGITGIEAGMFNARQNLVPLRELLAPAVPQDDTALNPPQPISLGILQVLLAAGGLLIAIAWIVRGKKGLTPQPPPTREAAEFVMLSGSANEDPPQREASEASRPPRDASPDYHPHVRRGAHPLNVTSKASSSAASMSHATQAAMKIQSSASFRARPRPIFGLVFHAARGATARGRVAQSAGLWPHRHAQSSGLRYSPISRADSPVFVEYRLLGWVLLGAAALLLACLALILPEAGPLWVRLPLARLIAFPWRLLGPALLFAAFLAAGAILALPARIRYAAVLALLVLAPLSVAPYLFPRPFAPVAEPTPTDIVRYEQGGGARATASANEYLPAWVRDPDPPPVLAAAYLAGQTPERLERDALPPGSQVTRLAAEPLADAYRLTLPAAGQARFLRFYFPGWRATVDGRPAAIVPDARHGLIQVAVPAGTHEVAIRFGTTPARVAGWLLAALGLVAAGLASARGVRQRWLTGNAAPPPLKRRAHAGESRLKPAQLKAATPERQMPRNRGFSRFLAPRNRPAEASTPAPARGIFTAIAVILLVTGLKALWIEPSTRWFRLRSPVEAPAMMQQAIGAQFANGAELIGYDIRRDAVRQGDALWVRLYWRALRPLDADFSPFLHLDAPTGEVTWANQTKLHAGDKPSRGWPVGFYVVDEYRLAAPRDTPAVVAALRAGWVDDQGQRVLTLEGQNAATLGQIRVSERQPLRPSAVPGSPAYRLGPAIRLLGHTAVLAEGQGTPAIDLTLYWQAEIALTENFTVFAHVLDASSTKAAQGDGPPLNGWYPTSRWAPGQIVADRRTIPLPTDAPAAGPLTVAVGLYRLDDGSRLPVITTTGERVPDDQIILPVLPPP